jgi:hypothetical protein
LRNLPAPVAWQTGIYRKSGHLSFRPYFVSLRFKDDLERRVRLLPKTLTLLFHDLLSDLKLRRYSRTFLNMLLQFDERTIGSGTLCLMA